MPLHRRDVKKAVTGSTGNPWSSCFWSTPWRKGLVGLSVITVFLYIACCTVPEAQEDSAFVNTLHRLPGFRQGFDVTRAISDYVDAWYVTNIKLPHLPQLMMTLSTVAQSAWASWKVGGATVSAAATAAGKLR